MQIKESEKIINCFLKEIKSFWQIIFLISFVCYAISFAHHFMANSLPIALSYFKTIDLISFAIAIILVFAIFFYKRKCFTLRAFRLLLLQLNKNNPDWDEKELTIHFTRNLRNKMKTVWLMGGALVILGVIFYWLTFTTKNMHIYFVVGLYSIMMNYPRKDLFSDVPYMVHESIKESREEEEFE